MAEIDPEGRSEQDEVDAVDFGPHFNDWLRASNIPVARIEMRLEEAALVVMSEGDDRARRAY